MCCLPCSPCGIPPRQFLASLASEEDRPNVEGFIQDICDKIGCDRLLRVQKTAVMKSVRDFFPDAKEEEYEPIVERAINAYIGCDPISLGFSLLMLLGKLLQPNNAYANLGDCLGNAGGFLQMAQMIISWLNQCLGNMPPIPPTPTPGGNPMCPPGKFNPPQPPTSPTGEYPESKDNRGCP